MNQVSVEQAAQMIGVSTATIRNWAKSGQIQPLSTCPLFFAFEQVLCLKEAIGTDSFDRLKRRANKKGADNYFLPHEYAQNTDLVATIKLIIDFFCTKNLNTEYVVFVAALRLLEKHQEVLPPQNSNLSTIKTQWQFKRKCVKEVIVLWLNELDSQVINQYQEAYDFISPVLDDDFLALLYQSLFKEGHKSEQGSYYTPTDIVTKALHAFQLPIKSFLDPCCGAGKYLLMAAKLFELAPEKIYGFDCDKIAVYIAKINMLLAYPNIEFAPNVNCLDALSELATGEIFCQTNQLIGTIDAIATNPPWGAYKNNIIKNNNKTNVVSGETFSLFLEKSIDLLANNGQLSFILPESILNIKIHADIRELVLNKTKIKKISLLGRQFTGVFTPVIRLDLIKQVATEDWQISLENHIQKINIKQSRFAKNKQFVFDIATNSPEQEGLLAKIYALKHHTLAKNAQWALGIVTGDNKKYILEQTIEGAEAIFRGSDVMPYSLAEPRSFVVFKPDVFQQVAPEYFFRIQEKLIYKFISKKLVFAYDNKQCLTLNSANILIPNMPIKVVLAFLNSSVFQYLFIKKFTTHKVLRGDLEQLPFPVLSESLQTQLVNMVDDVIGLCESSHKIDEFVFKVFNLKDAEIALIKETVGENYGTA